MASILGWWRGRSQVQRFDLYTRWTLYALYGLAPAMIAWGITNDDRAATGPAAGLVAISLVQAAIGVVLANVVLRDRQTATPARTRPVGLLVALTIVTLAGIALAASQLGADRFLAWFATPFLVLAYVGSLSLVMRLRYATAALVVLLAGPAAIDMAWAGRSWSPTMVGVAVVAGFSAICGYRTSLWMLDVVWELDRARGVQARLAVAEERLRFARDLHDVVGRGLSVVSLKSDLAARLAKRGRPEAADEMLEVRRVAQELLADVRDVVRGYRATDLGAELAGARSVLGSAGIECRIIGTTDAVGEQAQATLGWVVREGTTNVLRHSQATTCTIALQVAPESIDLTMDNDGVDAGELLVLGHGLLGLTERVTAAGGELTAERRPGGWFRLTARIPTSSGAATPAPAGPAGPGPAGSAVPAAPGVPAGPTGPAVPAAPSGPVGAAGEGVAPG